MSQFQITKDFEFCYGHRVWSQTLNGEYSDNLKSSCRHLHGHEAKVSVSLTSNELVAGMVTDFRHLEWLKKFINQYVDHHFIIDMNDPLYNKLVGNNTLITPVFVPERNLIAGHIVDLAHTFRPSEELELLEGFFIVNFVPTSENLSQWMATVVDNKMSNLGVSVRNITWWESPKSRSGYVL